MKAYQFGISPLNCSESDAQKLIISVTSCKMDHYWIATTRRPLRTVIFFSPFWGQYPYRFNELVIFFRFPSNWEKWNLEIDLYENTGWKFQGPTPRFIKFKLGTGIFFVSRCLRGCYKAPVQWQMPTFFPSLDLKIPNQKVIFM